MVHKRGRDHRWDSPTMETALRNVEIKSTTTPAQQKQAQALSKSTFCMGCALAKTLNWKGTSCAQYTNVKHCSKWREL